MTLDIRFGDGLAGMREVRDAGMVFTDVPAGVTRASFDVSPNIDEFMASAWSALRPDGVLVVMVADLRVAVEYVRQPHYRFDMVWRKSRATGFLNAKKRPLRAHEHILVFYREQPSYSVQLTEGHRPINSNAGRRDTGDNYGKCAGGKARAGATTRYPTSVLSAPCVGTTDPVRRHPQQKPIDLVKWFVGAYTSPGDLVVDPFAGSGATGCAAVSMGREFIGWEIDPDIYARGRHTVDVG